MNTEHAAQPMDQTPRMFPRWLRFFDPTLAAEDSNAVYEAFVRHRFRRTNRSAMGRALGVSRWGNSVILLAQLIGLLTYAAILQASFLGFMVTGRLDFLAIGLIPLAMSVLYLFVRRRFQSRNAALQRLGRGVSSLFSMRGLNVQALTDIYLAGLRGGEIGEAVCLEKREGALRNSLLIVGVLSLPALYIFTRWGGRGSGNWAGLGIWILFAHSVAMKFLLDMPSSAMKRLAHLSLELCAQHTAARRRSVMTEVRTLLISHYVVFTAGFGVLICFILAAVTYTEVTWSLDEGNGFGIFGILILASLLILGSGIQGRRIGLRDLPDAIRIFDATYRLFLERAILQDEEESNESSY